MKQLLSILLVFFLLLMAGCSAQTPESELQVQIPQADEVEPVQPEVESQITPPGPDEGVPMLKDDEVIAQLRADNEILKVLSSHNSVTCTTQTWINGEPGPFTTVVQYWRDDGMLRYDLEQYDETGEVVYCVAGYADEETPGAMYYAETYGFSYMEVFPSGEYERYVAQNWLWRGTGKSEELISRTEDEASGTVTITAQRNAGTQVTQSVTYVVDRATGLLSSIETETTAYWNTASESDVEKTTIVYDTPCELNARAARTILGAEDPCELTLILNPGRQDEETLCFRVNKDTSVTLRSDSYYDLYADAACNSPIEWIDASGETCTVYAVLYPAR